MSNLDGKRLASGVLRIIDPTTQIAAYSILARLARRCNVYLAANFRNTDVPLPKAVAEEDDLFRAFSADLGNLHSLHLLGAEDVDCWVELFEQFRGRDALILIFTTRGRKELLEGLRFYLAWYAHPRVLKVQFEEGSAHLAKGLMTGIEAILLKSMPEEEWALYVHPHSDPNWEDLDNL